MSRRSFPFLSIIVLLAGLAAPAAASAADELSSRLNMLAGSDLRSASQAEQADAVSLLNKGPGSLLRDGGSLIVNRSRLG